MPPIQDLVSTTYLHAQVDAETARKAAIVVAGNTRDAEDARLLLDVLGLLPEVPK